MSAERLEDDFGTRICVAFGLEPAGLRLTPLPASSTRLWALGSPDGLDVAGGRFVVKEFPYHDGERPAGLVVAAEFEHSLWQAGDILMPEPVRAGDGQLVPRLAGSRGAVVPVRVHRWLDGAPVPVPPPATIAGEAGWALAVIHRAGAVHSRRPGGSVRWWTREPRELVGPLTDAGLLTAGLAAMAVESLGRAEAILSAGDGLPGDWIYTHCDHKPANSLLVGARVAVLDWDESGYCHPRLEAIESALRWAGVESGDPQPELAGAFLRGYEEAAGASLGPVAMADFAKWVAAVAGWFWFTGRRALGYFADDTTVERASAAAMAADAIQTLHRTVTSVDRWAALLTGA